MPSPSTHPTTSARSPSRRVGRRPLLIAAGLVLVGFGFGAGVASAPAGSEPRWPFRTSKEKNCSRFEYAEFTVLGDRAEIVGSRIKQTLFPPFRNPDRDTVYQNDAGQFFEAFNIKLYYVNLLGAEGWELVTQEPVADGKPVLVRREIR